MKICRNSKALSALLLLIFLAPPALQAQKKSVLEILNADLTAADVRIGRDARKLIGNVRLKHEEVLMSCDSAYFYPSTSSVDAFSKVKVVQADTLTLTGERAYYNGNTRLAKVWNEVRLVNKEATLETDTLYYDRTFGIAWYTGGGTLVQEGQELTSMRGRFMTDQDVFYFMDSVHITNPDYEIFTDSLKYDSKTEFSWFSGPTEIISEQRYIYCEDGWSDMANDISRVRVNAYMEEAGRTISGDTLFFDQKEGYGEAFNNVRVYDSAQNMTLKGNFGQFYSERDFAMVTDSALLLQVDQGDTMYVHADTLLSVPDTANADTRLLKAYYKVKIYRSDMQLMCDSLEYSEADSLFNFHGEPILWSGENQLTSELMRIRMYDGQLDRMELKGVAFVTSMKDSLRFDQMRGKEMTGFFKDNQLVRIDVNGNGQTIYYADEQGIIVGANKTISSSLSILLKDNKIRRIIYTSQPDGTYFPLELFPESEMKLSDFKWYADWRPLRWQDVFIWK